MLLLLALIAATSHAMDISALDLTSHASRIEVLQSLVMHTQNDKEVERAQPRILTPISSLPGKKDVCLNRDFDRSAYGEVACNAVQANFKMVMVVEEPYIMRDATVSCPASFAPSESHEVCMEQFSGYAIDVLNEMDKFPKDHVQFFLEENYTMAEMKVNDTTYDMYWGGFFSTADRVAMFDLTLSIADSAAIIVALKTRKLAEHARLDHFKDHHYKLCVKSGTALASYLAGLPALDGLLHELHDDHGISHVLQNGEECDAYADDLLDAQRLVNGLSEHDDNGCVLETQGSLFWIHTICPAVGHNVSIYSTE
jgi:hypothetical protein